MKFSSKSARWAIALAPSSSFRSSAAVTASATPARRRRVRDRRLQHARRQRLARGDDLRRQGAGAASGKVSKVIVAEPQRRARRADRRLRNLISAGANAIVINPSSPNALNAVIAQAAARGIKVVSVDQRVTAPQAHNVDERPGRVRPPRRDVAVQAARRQGQRGRDARHRRRAGRHRSPHRASSRRSRSTRASRS